MAGRTTLRPAARSAARRTNAAADQVSGEAEPAALPLAKPMDATVGSVPYGDAPRSATSQSCSGMRPTPEANLRMPLKSDAAVVASPEARDCSARSADSTGHRWPVPCPLG